MRYSQPPFPSSSRRIQLPPPSLGNKHFPHSRHCRHARFPPIVVWSGALSCPPRAPGRRSGVVAEGARRAAGFLDALSQGAPTASARNRKHSLCCKACRNASTFSEGGMMTPVGRRLCTVRRWYHTMAPSMIVELRSSALPASTSRV